MAEGRTRTGRRLPQGLRAETTALPAAKVWRS